MMKRHKKILFWCIIEVFVITNYADPFMLETSNFNHLSLPVNNSPSNPYASFSQAPPFLYATQTLPELGTEAIVREIYWYDNDKEKKIVVEEFYQYNNTQSKMDLKVKKWISIINGLGQKYGETDLIQPMKTSYQPGSPIINADYEEIILDHFRQPRAYLKYKGGQVEEISFFSEVPATLNKDIEYLLQPFFVSSSPNPGRDLIKERNENFTKLKNNFTSAGRGQKLFVMKKDGTGKWMATGGQTIPKYLKEEKSMPTLREIIDKVIDGGIKCSYQDSTVCLPVRDGKLSLAQAWQRKYHYSQQGAFSPTIPTQVFYIYNPNYNGKRYDDTEQVVITPLFDINDPQKKINSLIIRNRSNNEMLNSLVPGDPVLGSRFGPDVEVKFKVEVKDTAKIGKFDLEDLKIIEIERVVFNYPRGETITFEGSNNTIYYSNSNSTSPEKNILLAYPYTHGDLKNELNAIIDGKDVNTRFYEWISKVKDLQDKVKSDPQRWHHQEVPPFYINLPPSAASDDEIPPEILAFSSSEKILVDFAYQQTMNNVSESGGLLEEFEERVKKFYTLAQSAPTNPSPSPTSQKFDPFGQIFGWGAWAWGEITAGLIKIVNEVTEFFDKTLGNIWEGDYSTVSFRVQRGVLDYQKGTLFFPEKHFSQIPLNLENEEEFLKWLESVKFIGLITDNDVEAIKNKYHDRSERLWKQKLFRYLNESYPQLMESFPVLLPGQLVTKVKTLNISVADAMALAATLLVLGVESLPLIAGRVFGTSFKIAELVEKITNLSRVINNVYGMVFRNPIVFAWMSPLIQYATRGTLPDFWEFVTGLGEQYIQGIVYAGLLAGPGFGLFQYSKYTPIWNLRYLASMTLSEVGIEEILLPKVYEYIFWKLINRGVDREEAKRAAAGILASDEFSGNLAEFANPVEIAGILLNKSFSPMRKLATLSLITTYVSSMIYFYLRTLKP